MSDLYFSKTSKARMVSINLEIWSMRLEVAESLKMLLQYSRREILRL